MVNGHILPPFVDKAITAVPVGRLVAWAAAPLIRELFGSPPFLMNIVTSPHVGARLSRAGLIGIVCVLMIGLDQWRKLAPRSPVERHIRPALIGFLSSRAVKRAAAEG